MNKYLLGATIVLAAAVAGLIIYSVMLMGDRNDLQTELAAVQVTLSDTQADISQLNSELETRNNEIAETEKELTEQQTLLATTQTDLDDTNSTLTAVREELTETETELSVTKGKLTTKESLLSAAQQEVDDLKVYYADLDEEIRLANQTLRGLDITISRSYQCYDVELIDNPDAVDPTWAELKTFVARDRIDRERYVLNDYDCSQFSRDLHNNAEAAGIRAAVVHIRFKGEYWGHALNAFLTTDHGLVYVDITGSDAIARIVSGEEYRAAPLQTVAINKVRDNAWWNSLLMYFYMESSDGGNAVVSDIEIFW